MTVIRECQQLPDLRLKNYSHISQPIFRALLVSRTDYTDMALYGHDVWIYDQYCATMSHFRGCRARASYTLVTAGIDNSIYDKATSAKYTFNTLRPRQNRHYFADDMFKWIFLNENVWKPIKISLKFVPSDSINNIPTLVQIMAWGQSGEKPLSDHWWLIYRRTLGVKFQYIVGSHNEVFVWQVSANSLWLSGRVCTGVLVSFRNHSG